MADVQVYVISAGRAGNVPAMRKFTAGLSPVWVVPYKEASTYKAAGALKVLGVAGRLAQQRNAALEHAFKHRALCAQLDDDLKNLQHYDPVTKKKMKLSVADALALIAEGMEKVGAYYGGSSPTDNAYFVRRAITDWGFIPAAMSVTAPNRIRYDNDLTLKEDWDYTCQHLAAWGVVGRRDDVLATFQYKTNAGGVQRYRTDALENEITNQLLTRWPLYLRPHGRREHELALKRNTNIKE